MDVPYILRRSALEFPNSLAVDDSVRRLSIGALVDRGERLANALDTLGVADGASVGILSENRSEYIEADIAIALGRRVRVALNARLNLDDYRYMVPDCDMRLLFHSKTHSETAAALREEFGLVTVSLDDGDDVSSWYDALIEAADPSPIVRGTHAEEPAWITYTSGTTGKPKGVILSHRCIREVAFNLLLEFGPVYPGELLVLTQALSHGAGYFVLPYLLRGGGVYIQRKFDPEEIWAVSARHEVRTLKAVPAMLPDLLAHANGSWGYDTTIYGASPIADPVLAEALERFGPTLMQGYGQSEAPCTITCLGKADHLRREARGSAGRAWRSVAVEVRGEDGQAVAPGELGEVVVCGSHMMTGYLGKPEATAEVMVDGWIHTRDMARIDDQGYIYLRGRTDDMINSGGHNVAPREVEDVLNAHPGVIEAVVLGMPDERWGSAVTAVVRVRDDGDLTETALSEFARPRLGIRAPKRIVFADAVPLTPYGKVDRAALRETLGGGPT